MDRRHGARGQVLIMFALFLLVLLGISALAVDYAGWLLTDRALQNVADHGALAGASEFDSRAVQANCGSGPGVPECNGARAQAWTSISNELKLNLSVTTINCLSTAGPFQGNSPPTGETDSGRASSGACTSEAPVPFGHTIWVSTPPPNEGRYTNFGGRFAQNFGVIWVRVDRDARSFLGGALGIQPKPRTGWATAGALPADFALETFCRNNIAPEGGVCENSAGLTIDGQGGIRLVRGDIGSNESLAVTSAVGNGVVVQSGNVFLVNRTCANSTWTCPNAGQPQGGISDGTFGGGKNAFYMAPLPVPQFQPPFDAATVVSLYNCNGANATTLCVPRKDQGSSNPGAPGDWTCLTSGSTNRCGLPTVTVGTPSTVDCIGQGGGNPQIHYYPTSVTSGASTIQGHAAPPAVTQEWDHINDDVDLAAPDTASPTPANPPTDYLYTDDINVTGAGGPQSTSFIVSLGQSGPRLSGTSTVRFVAFKTDGGVQNNTQNPVTLQVRLLPGSGTTPIAIDPTVRTLTDVPTRFEFTVGAGLIPAAQFNSLRLEFTFTSSGLTTAADERGGGISWAEIEHPAAQPPVAPMIPPGYYRSIDIPAGGCAILDPTAEYSSLLPYQMPGIYRFGGSGNPKPRIELHDGSYLIGDGVTLVFDSDWPDSGSNQGIAIGANGALVLNTMRTPGVTPCTPSENETQTVNQSGPYLGSLPHSAVCAAWAVDTAVSSGIRPGQSAWEYCDPNPVNWDSASRCIERTSYGPAARYHGITFYFTPDPGWSTPHAGMNIRNRFEMQGGVGGLAFRGVLYAPYDDVKISGGNGFSTVGQVLAWTAKFNGGNAAIDLDYPYDPGPAAPYLLEPTVNH
jgi:hypothetical protein